MWVYWIYKEGGYFGRAVVGVHLAQKALMLLGRISTTHGQLCNCEKLELSHNGGKGIHLCYLIFTIPL